MTIMDLCNNKTQYWDISGNLN